MVNLSQREVQIFCYKAKYPNTLQKHILSRPALNVGLLFVLSFIITCLVNCQTSFWHPFLFALCRIPSEWKQFSRKANSLQGNCIPLVTFVSNKTINWSDFNKFPKILPSYSWVRNLHASYGVQRWFRVLSYVSKQQLCVVCVVSDGWLFALSDKFILYFYLKSQSPVKSKKSCRKGFWIPNAISENMATTVIWSKDNQ